MKNRIAVLGRDSRLGSAMRWADRESGQCEFFGRDDVDLRNLSAVEDFCKSGCWEVVVLASAVTDVDFCETNSETAWLVNARAPEVIANAVRPETRVIFMSTDFVFDGLQKFPYNEAATPNPLSIYAKTKVAAEKAVLGASPKNLVIRSSWLFGGGKASLPDIMIDRACQHRTLEIVADRWASPTSAVDLSGAVMALANMSDAAGVVHYCNSGVCTPFEYVSTAIQYARERGHPILADMLIPTRAVAARVFTAVRPRYSAMHTARYEGLTGEVPRPWQEALRAHVFTSLPATRCGQTECVGTSVR